MIDYVCSDVLHWAHNYKARIESGEALPYHAVFCDSPYGLGKDVDIAEVLKAWLSGSQYDEFGNGMMLKAWDVVPSPQVWAALRSVSYPGAYLLSFAGTRTADLLGISIRLGGWRKVDEILNLNMAYGSGFNKVGTAPLAEAGSAFSGYGLSLRPAHEPILVFRNPREGTFAHNCREYGAGALNVDGARVSYQDSEDFERAHGGDTPSNYQIWGLCKSGYRQSDSITPKGRWPTNLLLTHSALPCPHCEQGCEECDGSGVLGCCKVGVKRVKGTNVPGQETFKSSVVRVGAIHDGGNKPTHYGSKETVTSYACLIECPQCQHIWRDTERGDCEKCGQRGEWLCAVARLGEQSGERNVGARSRTKINQSAFFGGGHSGDVVGNAEGYDDTGTATRFFQQSDWSLDIAERLANSEGARYTAKAASSERNAGLSGLYWRKDDTSPIGYTRIERQEYEQLPERQRAQGNIHVAVKPLSLLKYICTLIKPPSLYEPRLVVPFSGSGSEAIAAHLAGWHHITAIEREPDYVAISEARAKWWQENAAWAQSFEPGEILRKAAQFEARTPDEQLTLF